MREIRRRLTELKKENEELKHLLTISGKNRLEYEAKVKKTVDLHVNICIYAFIFKLDSTIRTELQRMSR